MQTSQAPWRWPKSPAATPPKHQLLQHTVSLSNLAQDQGWQWPRSPPSPSISSASTASRSATPTTPTNPWASSIPSTPVSTSVRDSSPDKSYGAPQQLSYGLESRSATPIAPTPVRHLLNLGIPSPGSQGYGAMATPGMDSLKSKPSQSVLNLMDMPISPTPTPFVRENPVAALAAAYAKSIATPALLSQFKLQTPNLLARQGWETSTSQRAYGWALQNPRTALLFLMCEDLTAWPKAHIYGLVDGMLPYEAGDLHGIVSDPNRAINLQWRVATKELPRNGQYTEYSSREFVPLHQNARIPTTGQVSSSLDKVSWLGESNSSVYVRKRFVCSRPSQKSAVLSQIASFKKLEHSNVAKILSWYSQGSTMVGFVTASARCDLEEYLNLQSGMFQARYVLDWVHQLTQALEYIHGQGVAHSGIRPQKILIDHNFRAYFSAFGISSDGPDVSPPRASTVHSATAYSTGQQALKPQAYVYAAPEVVARRKTGRPADVFSLGCVFLTMLTVALGHSATVFAAFRSQFSQDESFQANVDRVGTWIKQLQIHATVGRTGSVAGPTAQFREKTTAASVSTESQALQFVATMIAPEANRRIKMRKLAPFIARWNDSRAFTRRRSFDGGTSSPPDSTRWPGTGAMDSYFGVR